MWPRHIFAASLALRRALLLEAHGRQPHAHHAQKDEHQAPGCRNPCPPRIAFQNGRDAVERHCQRRGRSPRERDLLEQHGKVVPRARVRHEGRALRVLAINFFAVRKCWPARRLPTTKRSLGAAPPASGAARLSSCATPRTGGGGNTRTLLHSSRSTSTKRHGACSGTNLQGTDPRPVALARAMAPHHRHCRPRRLRHPRRHQGWHQRHQQRSAIGVRHATG